MAQLSNFHALFNSFLQIFAAWIGVLVYMYTIRTYNVAAYAAQQGTLTNQLALTAFCQSTNTTSSSACAQVISSTNVSSLAVSLFADSHSDTVGTNGRPIYIDNGWMACNILLVVIQSTILSIIAIWLDCWKFSRKDSQPDSSKSSHLQPLRRSTTELESGNGQGPSGNGQEPVK